MSSLLVTKETSVRSELVLEALDGGSSMALKLWGRKSSLIPPDENTVTRVQCAAVTIWRGGRKLESTVLTSFIRMFIKD